MEDGMHIGDLLQHVEDAPNGIAESTRKQKPEARCGKQRPQLRDKPYNRPAQAQVQHRRDPARTEHPERFGNYADNGNRQTNANRTTPWQSTRVTKQYGLYEAAINRYMKLWSSTLNTRLAFSAAIA